jgi:predicted RNA-binding Zn-ribbon protein involved in translation (DUF1610 family)
MTKPYTAKTTDHSDSGHFSFSFYCDKCGKEWRSSNQDFTGMGSTAVENDEALRLLWAEEHRLAYETVNLDARMYLALCPVCGKHVRDDCFNIAEIEHGGVCKDCSDK